MNNLISVIVPVFKVERFLSRCIKSIQNQTYKNIEIILVDDGSPDCCPEICDAYAQMDSRIQVIHKKNGGLSDARNAGIEKAKGNYLCFVDSDDYIQPAMLEHMMATAQKYDVRLVVSNLIAVDEEGHQVVSSNKSPIHDGIFTAEELLPKIYQELGWYFIVAWNKLYHHSLFDKTRFPIGKIHEDEYIVAQVMWDARKIACIASEEYIYTYQRKGSIMSSKKVQSQCDWLEALYQRFEFCKGFTTLNTFNTETRAVYFRELNNLFLIPELFKETTYTQQKKAKIQYASMEGKSKTELINWILFQISPKLENRIVQRIRKMRG